MDIATLNDALGRLRAKYGLPQGAIVSGTPWPLLQLPSGQEIPLLRWRAERRFTELKNIIDGGTLEGVSTLRFATFRDGGDLLPPLAAELDLACHLTGSRIVRLYAVMAPGNRACNVILRLENGVSGCVECGVGLPPGTAPVDRHEDPFGGSTMMTGTIELLQPVRDIMFASVFTDFGNVWYDAADIDLSDLCMSVGVGVQFRALPISLYYGYPILTSYDHLDGRSGRFHFSIGFSY